MARSKNILSVLVVLIAVSCNQNKTIINTINGEISDYDHTVLMLDSDTLKVTDGKFEVNILSDYPVFRTLKYGKDMKELFIVPGNSMKITFNASDFKGTFKIEGDGVNEHIVLDSLVSIIHETIDFDRNIYDNPEDGSKYLDSCMTVYLNTFDNLNRVYPTSEIFKEFGKANLEYNFGIFKIEIGLMNNITDSVFYDFTRNMVIENEKYIEIYYYREFLISYTNLTLRKNVRNFDSLRLDNPDSVVDVTLSIINTFKSKKIKDYLTYYFLNQRLERDGIEGFDRFYTYFMSYNSDSSYAKELKRSYEQKLELPAGTNAPEFYCTDAEGNSHSLKEYRNKIVYIDFWATWCGPCRKEMPDFLVLQEEYKGKDIVFLRISLDDDINKWLKEEENSTSEGISLFAGNGFRSEAAKAFQVESIPNYVLIDREGKIINADARRPSSAAIRIVLDALLSKMH